MSSAFMRSGSHQSSAAGTRSWYQWSRPSTQPTSCSVRRTTSTCSIEGQSLQRLVGGRLERHDAALAPAAVGGDQHLALGVVDATRERLRREAAEHDRVRRADARAGQQRHRQLGHHAEVDRDAVALDDAEAAQHVGEAVDLVVQLAVADHALVAGLADPDVGGLVAAAGREVAIEAVHRRVQLAVGEPLEERRVGVVQPLGRLAVPGQLVERARHPEAHRVGLGLGVERFVGDTGARLELAGGGKTRRSSSSASMACL